jgi:A/G-specific adenine glycosylase
MKRSQERNKRAATSLLPAIAKTDGESDPWPSSQWKSEFRRRLLGWYRRHSRDLPWRRTNDAYAIWISEIMLQQTQVATVIPYYERFLAQFPTALDLAAADEQDVLRLWEGLGYYRRARQLHAAAKKVVAEHEGIFPSNAETARRLPGIGRYTAGAILSLAFGAREPILEANTLRLFSRLLAYRGDPLNRQGQMLLWRAAAAILPRRGSGEVNQALMELGSQICTPREPSCECCPVASLCPTRREGLQSTIPRQKARPRIEQVREAAVVVRNGNRVLIVRRSAGERWAGLWDFPRFSLAAEGDLEVQRELASSVDRLCRIQINPRGLLKTLHHGVTRFRITLECHEADLVKSRGKCKQASRRADQRWIYPKELADYPFSMTGRKIAKLVMSRI